MPKALGKGDEAHLFVGGDLAHMPLGSSASLDAFRRSMAAARLAFEWPRAGSVSGAEGGEQPPFEEYKRERLRESDAGIVRVR